MILFVIVQRNLPYIIDLFLESVFAKKCSSRTFTRIVALLFRNDHKSCNKTVSHQT